jgi:hypothetical protein
MPLVVFEPTTQALERAKIVHALHRPVTVIGGNYIYHLLNIKETLCFAQRIQLCVSYDSQNKS